MKNGVAAIVFLSLEKQPASVMMMIIANGA